MTPGPWKTERGNVGNEHPLFVTAPGRDGFRPWSDADALVIAAVPVMLFELKRAEQALRNHVAFDVVRTDSHRIEILIEASRIAEVIAKASGRI